MHSGIGGMRNRRGSRVRQSQRRSLCGNSRTLCADGTMPMHLSVHFNGWADGYPNPENYTRDRMFHSRYETAYVDAAINEATVKKLVGAPQRLRDVFGAVKDHLSQTFGNSIRSTIWKGWGSSIRNPHVPKERTSFRQSLHGEQRCFPTSGIRRGLKARSLRNESNPFQMKMGTKEIPLPTGEGWVRGTSRRKWNLE